MWEECERRGGKKEKEEDERGRRSEERKGEGRKRERRGYDNSVAHKGQSSLAVGK